MTTGILSWVLGRAADEISRRVLAPDLEKRLTQVVSQWAKSVSEVAFIHPNAFFPSLASAIDYEEDFPRLLRVRETISTGKLPTEEAWFDALAEQWKTIRLYHENEGEEAQAFFNLPEDHAREHLIHLAKSIHDECTRDTRLFNPYVASCLNELTEEVRGISERIPEASLPSEIGGEA